MSEAIVWRRVPPFATIWPAWLLAAAIGSLLPIMPNVFDQATFSVYWNELVLSSWLGGVAQTLAAATILAFFQYVVLRMLIRRESLDATLWIPASAAGAVAAFVLTAVWQATVPVHLISISAIAAALPAGFPMVEVIGQLFNVVIALCVALGQGVVLSRVFSRSLITYWIIANLLAALLAGLVIGIRQHEINDWLRYQMNPDEGVLTWDYVINTALGGVVYAAVTGAALLRLAGGNRGVPG